MLTPSALVMLGSYTHHTCSMSPSTPITLHHLQQLFKLQEPEAGFMLAVGLDFGKQPKSQLCLPLTQSQCFVTSGHTASDATVLRRQAGGQPGDQIAGPLGVAPSVLGFND